MGKYNLLSILTGKPVYKRLIDKRHIGKRAIHYLITSLFVCLPLSLRASPSNSVKEAQHENQEGAAFSVSKKNDDLKEGLEDGLKDGLDELFLEYLAGSIDVDGELIGPMEIVEMPGNFDSEIENHSENAVVQVESVKEYQVKTVGAKENASKENKE